MRSCLTWFKKHEVCFVCCIFVLTILLYLLQIFLRDAVLRDVALRYAPMAECFAAGDFRYAFHPRVQSLHPLISGCICYISGCSGFTGVQLSSLLFFGLCVFPLYNLLKTVFDRKVAGWGTLLLPLASQVAAISVSGLRESHKMFALLLITLGVVTVFKERERYRGYLLTGIGCGLAFCIRTDLVLPSLCLLSGTG
ncbi:MAG: glycosyltransferase family 39 protein, partial [Lentisphaeria bacterium]|nr:glycosyltransferase family 39 protein [Lentisphaeria bacterium]